MMSTSVLLKVVLGFTILVSGALFALARAKRLSTYKKAVGLSLDELVGLLPPSLRGRSYERFMVGPGRPGRITVGLIYRADSVRRGNPPNVGLEFDAKSGELLNIREDGVGLGLK